MLENKKGYSLFSHATDRQKPWASPFGFSFIENIRAYTHTHTHTQVLYTYDYIEIFERTGMVKCDCVLDDFRKRVFIFSSFLSNTYNRTCIAKAAVAAAAAATRLLLEWQ